MSVIAVVLAGCAEPQQQESQRQQRAMTTPEEFPVLTGAYLGQPPPGAEPEVFAPGIVSTGMYTRDVAMTPEGDELFYGVSVGGITTIMQTKRVDGRWTKPEVAPFAADSRYMNLEPHISPDGQTLYFLSNRPPSEFAMPPDAVGNWVIQDIWAVDREDDGWGEPYNIGPPVNSDDAEFFPSVTRDGTMYFTRGGAQESYIYRSRLIDGEYAEPERLPQQVNSTRSQFNAFISPDEDYLIICVVGREDSWGGMDYFVAFRNDNDEWSEAINMGEQVNTPRGGEFSPYVSPDGRYFFFMSSRRVSPSDYPDTLTAEYLKDVYLSFENGNASIYWMDASFIDELRPEGW